MTEWRPIPSAPGYEASDLGEVRSLRRGWPIVRKPEIDPKGYLRLRVTLDSGRTKWKFVHGAVLEAFVGPRPEGQEVRHLDGNPANNRLPNLAYGTHSENVRDTIRHGRHPMKNRTHCPSGHAYDEVNTKWYQGRRYCRPCNSALTLRRAREKRAAEKGLGSPCPGALPDEGAA